MSFRPRGPPRGSASRCAQTARRALTAGARRPHISAALLLALVVFGYLWPVLVGGKILSPIAALYAYVPWTHYTPSDVTHYYNPLLLDLPVVDYPWRFLARELIREGTFPAWNPYALGGIPFYSNSQTGLFSLFNVPLWILPLTYALGLSAALKLFAGAFGAYLLARRLRLGFLPGLLAGIAFGFSAVNITWLAHETLTAVVVMLPWAILFVERIFERARPADAIGLAGAIAIGLGGGHPGMQVHLLVVTGLYTLARTACARRGEERFQALALVGGGLAAGTLLMAFMLIPEARSSHETVGVLARRTASLPGTRLPFATLRTVLLPDWWGRPSSAEAPADASNVAILYANYCERTFYAGGVALLFAAIGLLTPGGWRRKAPFVLVGVVGLAIAVRTPGLIWLATHLPLLESVEPQRIHFAFALAVAVLAAFGLQALLDAPALDRRRLAVPFVALLVGAFALSHSGAAAGDLGRTVHHFLTGTDYERKGVLAQTASVWFLLFALGVGALLALARARPRWRVAIAIAVVLLATGDAYHFVNGFQPMGPESKVIPPITPAVAFLEQHRSDGRVAGVGEVLPNDWTLVYGLQDVRGYDPPQPTRRMLGLWRVIYPEQVSWQPLHVPSLGAAQARVLDVLGTRYVVAPPGAAPPRPNPERLRPVYGGEDATILESPTATPRALVPARVLLAAGRQAARARILERGFDPHTMVVVERDQAAVGALVHGEPAAQLPPVRGSAAIVQDRNASVTIEATLDRPGLVVLNDQLTEGWSVHVDGRPAAAVHVNTVMRGVIVPAGHHQIIWSYRIPGLRLGALLSLLTLLALAAAAVVLHRSRRRGLAERQ